MSSSVAASELEASAYLETLQELQLVGYFTVAVLSVSGLPSLSIDLS